MKSISIERTSVNCEASWHDFYKTVHDGRRVMADSIAFSGMNQAFVTFACLGRAANHYVPLKHKQEIFIAFSLDATLHIPVLAALAFERLVDEEVEKSEALKTIMSTKGIIPVVEGWAQGGAEVFKEEVERSQLPPSEWLTNHIGTVVKRFL